MKMKIHTLQPPFRVLSMHMKTVHNLRENENEILMISLLLHPSVSISGVILSHLIHFTFFSWVEN
jgi:hypothetical protein